MIDTMTSTAPLLKEKRVRVLAVTSPKGANNPPGVPSVAEFYQRCFGEELPESAAKVLVA